MASSVRKQLCRYYSPVEQGILVHLDLAQSASTIQTYCQIGNLKEILDSKNVLLVTNDIKYSI